MSRSNRTSRSTGVSVSWWFYLLFVLPLQLLFAFYKALIYVCVLVGICTLAAARFARDRWRERGTTKSGRPR